MSDLGCLEDGVVRDCEPETPPFIATKNSAASARFCPNKICHKLELKIHDASPQTHRKSNMLTI